MAVVDVEHIQTQDEVIQEVRQIKDDLAKAFAYDMKKMLEEARRRQQTGGHAILSPPAKHHT
jgi:hypothetical protein